MKKNVPERVAGIRASDLAAIRRRETREPLIRGLEEKERRRILFPSPPSAALPPPWLDGVHVLMWPMAAQCDAGHNVARNHGRRRGCSFLFGTRTSSVLNPRPGDQPAWRRRKVSPCRVRECDRDTVRGWHYSREHTGADVEERVPYVPLQSKYISRTRD